MLIFLGIGVIIYLIWGGGAVFIYFAIIIFIGAMISIYEEAKVKAADKKIRKAEEEIRKREEEKRKQKEIELANHLELVKKTKEEKLSEAKQITEEKTEEYGQYMSMYEEHLEDWEKKALYSSFFYQPETFLNFVAKKKNIEDRQNLYKVNTYEKYVNLHSKCIVFDKSLTKLSEYSWKQLQESRNSCYFEKYLNYLCNKEKEFKENFPNCVKCKKINSEDFYTYTDSNERLCCSNCEFEKPRTPWKFKTWDLVRKDEEERERKYRMERVKCSKCGGSGKHPFNDYALRQHEFLENVLGREFGKKPAVRNDPCDLCRGQGTCFRYENDKYVEMERERIRRFFQDK